MLCQFRVLCVKMTATRLQSIVFKNLSYLIKLLNYMYYVCAKNIFLKLRIGMVLVSTAVPSFILDLQNYLLLHKVNVEVFCQRSLLHSFRGAYRVLNPLALCWTLMSSSVYNCRHKHQFTHRCLTNFDFLGCKGSFL